MSPNEIFPWPVSHLDRFFEAWEVGRFSAEGDEIVEAPLTYIHS